MNFIIWFFGIIIGLLFLLILVLVLVKYKPTFRNPLAGHDAHAWATGRLVWAILGGLIVLLILFFGLPGFIWSGWFWKVALAIAIGASIYFRNWDWLIWLGIILLIISAISSIRSCNGGGEKEKPAAYAGTVILEPGDSVTVWLDNLSYSRVKGGCVNYQKPGFQDVDCPGISPSCWSRKGSGNFIVKNPRNNPRVTYSWGRR